MNRRSFLGGLCGTGVVTLAGCTAPGGTTTLSEPSVAEDSPGRRALIFAADGEEVGNVGVDGTVRDGLVRLTTEFWHRDGTTVDSIRLQVWMPESARETPAEVAVVSPVEGDSSPPPSVTLSTPDRGLGTVIELTDLDDLADETISTLALLVVPGSETATELTVDATVELSGRGLLAEDFTLDGTLELEYPELADR